MIESSEVIVDSNIIIDIVSDDPKWVTWSAEALSRYPICLINSMIFAELCYNKASKNEVDELTFSLELLYQEVPKEALFFAAQAYRKYRRQGGTKTVPLPDFFIGAHAEALGVPILTRDVSRYRIYFPNVQLISP